MNCTCRITTIVVGFILAAGCLRAQDLSELYRHASTHVVEIEMRTADGDPLAFGSGFVLNGGEIVTNHHVIDVGSSAVCKMHDGTIFNVLGVVAHSEAKDLAVIRIDASNLPNGLELDTTKPAPGSRVAVIGNPRGESMTISDGIVSAVREQGPEGTHIQFTAPISPGSSGGPVLSMAGKVLGVVSYMRTDGVLLNYGVSAADVSSLRRGEIVSIAKFNELRNRRSGERVLTHFTPLASATFEIPEGTVHRLRGRDKRDLADAAKYSMILPNGDIINLFRYYRAMELNSIVGAVSGLDRQIETLGMDGQASFVRRDGSRVRINIEDLPPKCVFPPNAGAFTRGIIVDLPSIGEDVPIEVEAALDGFLVCSISNSYIFVLRTGHDAPRPEGGYFGDIIYFPVADITYEGSVIRVYDALDPKTHKPTLDEMAFHAERGGAPVVVYSCTSTNLAAGSTSRGGVMSGSAKVRKSHITDVTHKWSSREPELSFIEQKPTSTTVIEQASGAVEDKPEPIVTHTVTLKDGRVLKGRVIAETRSKVKFMLVVGSIEHEMELRRSEVTEISRHDK